LLKAQNYAKKFHGKFYLQHSDHTLVTSGSSRVWRKHW